MDLYGPLLARALFPAFEAARGRPTVSLLRTLRATERWALPALRDFQVGLARRLLRHAYLHTAYYRDVLDDRSLRPEDIATVDDLQRLPLLARDTVRSTMASRRAGGGPAVAVRKSTSGTTGEPVTVMYNAESRHWRDATRWRGYGWGGYQIGMRALHYWGVGPPDPSWVHRRKVDLDRVLKRDLYVDSTPRNDAALARVVEQITRFEPSVIVAYAAAAGTLAQYVLDHDLRRWSSIAVLAGAERLWPHERAAIERAFGPVYETYGCREVMLIAAECDVHDGMHTSMETMIVELIVREPDGTTRAARPGELGEVVVTDLHNLACPMIRYVTGDLAVARAEAPCACGRELIKIGPVEGRTADTLRDGDGHPVGGLVFNILFGVLGPVARHFQVMQHRDGHVVMKIVPVVGDRVPERDERAIREFAAKYLPGVAFAIEYVAEVPLTAAGKRKVVVVEPPG